MAKKAGKRKKTETPKKTTSSKEELEKTLMENFVGLQRVLTNLAVKFDALSDQISKLLQLFEISAKSLAEKQPLEPVMERDKGFLKKLDTLLDQNKTIAKGLTLMEGKLRERIYGHAFNMGERERPRYPKL